MSAAPSTLMAEGNATLQIVAGELGVEIDSARAALEAFADATAETTRLEAFASHLHLAQGALRLAEVYGGALLAEEMELVARHAIAQSRGDRADVDGLDALMRAVEQLPSYVDRVLSGGRDLPLALLPLLNDLRAVRGGALLSEGTLLTLNLYSDEGAHPLAGRSRDVAEVARRLRPRFQLALLGWIRGEDVHRNLAALAEVAEQVEMSATSKPVFQVWWVVGAVLEALRSGGLEATASVKRLLGQADRDMRRLIERGESQHATQPPQELLNNLLFYVARSTLRGPRIDAVSGSFRLAELLPPESEIDVAEQTLSAPSVRLMKTVAAAIREDLTRVKDVLDIFVRRGSSQVEELVPQLEMLRKISDTLGVLGLGAQRDRVQVEIALLKSIVDQRVQPDDSALLRIAAALLEVEDGLDGQLVRLIVRDPTEAGTPAAVAADVDFHKVEEAVLRECAVNMARIKEAVTQALSAPTEAQGLDQVPQLVRGITAGLLMLDRQRAVEIMEAVGLALARIVRPEREPLASDHLDRLADALVAVEYYMETLQSGRSEPLYLLENAESCLAAIESAADAGATLQLLAIPAAELARPERGSSARRLGESQPQLALPAATEIIRLEEGAVLQGSDARAADADDALAAPPVPAVEPEFVALFIEEARENIASLEAIYPRWEVDPQDLDALRDVRRAFHTLKGSGRIVGALALGEFAWSVENLLNRVISQTLPRSPDIVAVVRAAIEALPTLVVQLESGGEVDPAVAAIAARADGLSGRETMFVMPPGGPLPSLESLQALVAEAQLAAQAAGERAVAAQARAIGDAHQAGEHDALDEQMSFDPLLRDIFRNEAAGHVAIVHDFLQRNAGMPAPVHVTEALYRACHTLSGIARTAGIHQGSRIAEPMDRVVRKLHDSGHGLPSTALELLRDTVACLDDVVAHLDEDTGYFPSQPRLVAAWQELEQVLDVELARSGEPATAAEAPEATEATEAAETTETTETTESTESTVEPQAAQETAAEVAGAQAGATVAQTAEESTTQVDAVRVEAFVDADGDVDAEAREQAQTLIFAGLSADEMLPSDGDLTSPEILLPTPDGAPIVPQALIDAVAELQARAGSQEPPAQDLAFDLGESPLGSVVEAAAQPDEAAVVERELEFDEDIAAIFTEEASELLEQAEGALSAWSRDRADAVQLTTLKRALHTIKGGARMAGLRAMGDLSHELESFLATIEFDAALADARAIDVLQLSLDELHRLREAAGRGLQLPVDSALIARVKALARAAVESTPESAALAATQAPPPPVIDTEVGVTPDDAGEPAAEPATALVPDLVSEPMSDAAPQAAAGIAAELPGEPMPASPAVAPAGQGEAVAEVQSAETPFEFRARTILAEIADRRAVTAPEDFAPPPLPGREPVVAPERQELARVDAELLDELLNNAGEVSIFRARIEQQMTQIEFNLAELGRTVTRLRDQLRKLEMETEAQVLFRHQSEVKGRPEFDPLELDRYSSIQQLTRALAESVSDVASLESLLESLNRDAQNLLHQQSRIVTELQNGLMRTRMVPFQRHVQRLSRIVRQVAQETGKKADLVVEGASGELDRQVLERMLPPFEHMLRNSVVHGIELPAERVAAHKPETGRIAVSLHREGAEVVIVVADDGAGMSLAAIRAKALQAGLVQPEQTLTDEEALQLILEPGFSTADRLTQQAGRGVGMDVVATEVKKLGGSLYLESTAGQGARFTIRLPFTLAITQSLIVRVAEEIYALPVATVEGVARVPKVDVQRYLEEATPSFEYGGQTYRFQHLGGFLGAGPLVPPENDAPMPVILVRAGEHSAALLADELVGSREIVVKSVGPQIAGIRGISGATILGDGRIVLILDMGALVRSEWRGRASGQDAPAARDERVLALVVDDSITVRRVTQRLLKRNGMRVLTAKDGVEALTLLQEHTPDVILLDIEMPRMDGYEVAAHVRGDPRLADVPIIMITSRVGEKHRARAIELGVDDYLGKPYQESQLLDAIEPLVFARRRQVS